MRGTILYGPRDVRFEERPDPTILEPTDAILRISTACVCGSDLWPYRGIEPITRPTPMGHEYVGIIEEVGSEVRTIKPGQFVIGSFFASDNTCPICQAGYQSRCLHSQPIGALGAQAERLRIPLADGTLVATPDIPSTNLLPDLLAAMDVSRICLGCMGFGDATRWIHQWVLDDENSRPIIKKALELGINFFDTANVYSLGASEEILGRALKDFANRDEVVIATKVHGKMYDGPNGSGLSRKAILSEIDHSLKRVGTDYVDLYQIHRWDYQTPIEETMEALHDVVRAGKARYLGASAMFAWQFQKALYVAEQHGWTRFVSMQDHLNLLYREEEREMLPLCREEKIGVIPYSPLASGRLTRDWSSTSTLRSETDQVARSKYDATSETDQQVVARVADIAEKHGVPRVQIALAWLLQKQAVTAPIIGATKISHLEDAVSALDIQLTQEEVASLEESYVPHAIVGHQ